MVTLTPRGSRDGKPPSAEARAAVLRQTLIFALVSAVNGGFIGVTGPSLHTLGKATGLGQGSLGRIVFTNRFAKLLGSFLWAAYAKAAQKGHAPCSASFVLAGCSSVIAGATLCIATMRTSAIALQCSLAVAGAAYGVSDSAITLLTVWANREPIVQRTHVAMLNVGFTVGALVTPAVIAGALRLGGSSYAGFYVLGAFACVVSMGMLTGGATTTPPPPDMELPRSHTEASADGQSRREGSHRMRNVLMIGAMSTILFCVTGCEHAVATWLPSYGQHVGGIGEQELALMSAGFWLMICIGRVLWAAISSAITSGFPPLAFDGVLMLLSSMLIAQFGRSKRHGRHPLLAIEPASLLWCGTLGLGFGCSSSLPCAITLPAEARVELTPFRLLALNLAGSAGEMLMPFLIGQVFERGEYHHLGTALVVLEALVVGCTAIAWRVATLAEEEEAELASNGEEMEEIRQRLVQSEDEVAAC